MIHLSAIRLVAVAAVLAATACAPVFAPNDQAGLSPVTFAPSASQATVLGQR